MESSTEKTTMSRQELYEQLWKTPATKLAKQFGVSNVGLGKICQRHDIPRPPRGYWAKIAFGKRLRRPPLPRLDNEALEEVRIFRRGFFDETESSPAVQTPVQPRTVVPETLTDPHPLVKQTRAFLRSTKQGDDGITKPDRKTCLNIRVSPASRTRALLVFDTFVKQWERLGGTISLGQHGNEPATRAHFGDTDTPIELFEETQRDPRDENTDRWSYRNWKYRPTGKLVLQTNGAHWGFRHRWADGKQQRLENRIDSFISGLRDILEETRLHRLDEQCVARQRRRLAELRAAAKKRDEAEKTRRTQIDDEVSAWRKAKGIRDYLGALRTKLDAKKLAPINPEAFAEWLDWATWYADYIDPLTMAPDRPEFVQLAQNVPVGELDLTRATSRLVQYLPVTDSDGLYQVDKSEIDKITSQWQYRTWSEICRVLEGLGYDVRDREYYDW